ncbi:MAG TPA: type II secretion system minor pseudopilin GspH [Gammaproteobacteria bacterium]
MPTSVTGTSEYAVTRTAQRGFSFLELLVVVAIIGLLAAAVSWSIGALGSDRELADETTRLRGMLTLLHEESLMQGRDYGVMFTETGYRFYVYDYQQLAWVEPQGDELLVQHSLRPQLLISLLLDGREVRLDDNFESRDVDTPEPQIMLLASGEVTPFTIEVARDGVDGRFELTAQLDGKITVAEEDFD